MSLELDPETEMFRDSARKWVDRECPKDWCRALERREHQYPQELWDKLTHAGYHGIGIAEEHGGLGGDIVIQSVFMREFARTAAGLGWIWGITAFSGASAIRLHGSEQQKRQFLPQMAQGRLKTAISFTEPGGGTDLLGGMKTSADKVASGWVINGEKIWSTTADTADYLLLLARSDRNVAKRSQGVSLFFVPRDTQGVTVTPLDKLGMRALNSCSIRLDRVFVPDDLLLGEAGKAWKEVTQTLNAERIRRFSTMFPTRPCGRNNPS
jgi:acyl-CoA dehydrogenase